MSKVIFSKQKEKTLIPNSQIEQMFLSICTDEQMSEFNKLVEKGLIHTASAYASQRVLKTFQYWRDSFIKKGGELDYLQWMLYRNTK